MIHSCNILTISDTNVLKGIALLLLLAHHLFYVDNGLYSECHIAGFPLVCSIGQYSKVCVALFVFLSGYGLMAKEQANGGMGSVWQFYRHRFSKLYTGYWYVWAVFVPIGYFVFHRTFADAYPQHTLVMLVLDFLGLINCTGHLGYNGTWWFMSCIILLYLLFPLLYRALEKCWPLAVFAACILTYLPFSAGIGPIRYYIVAFVLGMVYSKVKNTPHEPTVPLESRNLARLRAVVGLPFRREATVPHRWHPLTCHCSSIHPFKYAPDSLCSPTVRRASEYEHLPVPYVHLLLLVPYVHLCSASSAAHIPAPACHLPHSLVAA